MLEFDTETDRQDFVDDLDAETDGDFFRRIVIREENDDSVISVHLDIAPKIDPVADGLYRFIVGVLKLDSSIHGRVTLHDCEDLGPEDSVRDCEIEKEYST